MRLMGGNLGCDLVTMARTTNQNTKYPRLESSRETKVLRYSKKDEKRGGRESCVIFLVNNFKGAESTSLRGQRADRRV